MASHALRKFTKRLKPALTGLHLRSHISSAIYVKIVLQYLKTLHPITDLALKDLTKKITMLLCLLTEQRCQDLTKFDISLMQELPDIGFKIVSTNTLKNRKCGRSTGGLAVIFKSKFHDWISVEKESQYFFHGLRLPRNY